MTSDESWDGCRRRLSHLSCGQGLLTVVAPPARIGVTSNTTVTVRVVSEPSPACRPRVTRWGTYYTKPYETWMSDCQKQLAAQVTTPLLGNLWCAVEIICTKPRTGKLSLPRGDVDNYVKGALDGGTKAGVWGDDGQIEFLLTTKRYARPGEDPGAIINCGVLQ